MKDAILTTEILLRWPDVQSCCGLSRSRAHELAAEGKFPKPVKIGGGRASAWIKSEIEAWISTKIAERENGGVR